MLPEVHQHLPGSIGITVEGLLQISVGFSVYIFVKWNLQMLYCIMLVKISVHGIIVITF